MSPKTVHYFPKNTKNHSNEKNYCGFVTCFYRRALYFSNLPPTKAFLIPHIVRTILNNRSKRTKWIKNSYLLRIKHIISIYKINITCKYASHYSNKLDSIINKYRSLDIRHPLPLLNSIFWSLSNLIFRNKYTIIRLFDLFWKNEKNNNNNNIIWARWSHVKVLHSHTKKGNNFYRQNK